VRKLYALQLWKLFFYEQPADCGGVEKYRSMIRSIIFAFILSSFATLFYLLMLLMLLLLVLIAIIPFLQLILLRAHCCC